MDTLSGLKEEMLMNRRLFLVTWMVVLTLLVGIGSAVA